MPEAHREYLQGIADEVCASSEVQQGIQRLIATAAITGRFPSEEEIRAVSDGAAAKIIAARKAAK